VNAELKIMRKKLVLPYFQYLSLNLPSGSEQTKKSQSPGPHSNPGLRDTKQSASYTTSEFIIITTDHWCKEGMAHLLHVRDHFLYAETVITEKYLLQNNNGTN
jgi:hypothetical protein